MSLDSGVKHGRGETAGLLMPRFFANKLRVLVATYPLASTIFWALPASRFLVLERFRHIGGPHGQGHYKLDGFLIAPLLTLLDMILGYGSDTYIYQIL